MMTQNVRGPAIMRSGVLVIAIAAGGCTASARPAGSAAGHAASHPAPAKAAASPAPSHRPSQPTSVQLVVEASGDLRMHAPAFKRALADGGCRAHNIPP